jgi:predicted XRE-type DNA-binding protein
VLLRKRKKQVSCRYACWRKLESFFNRKLVDIGRGIRRQAIRIALRRRAKSLSSRGEDVLFVGSVLEARTDTPKVRLADAEEAAFELKLDVIEKAVYFGLLAGLSESRIANALGCSQPTVSSFRKKVLEKGKRFL